MKEFGGAINNKVDHNNEVIDSMMTYRASVTWESRKCLGLCTNLTMTLCSLYKQLKLSKEPLS